MGQILAINAGSATLKAGLFAAPDAELLAEWQDEWNPHAEGAAEAGVRTLLEVVEPSRIVAVGHRVVHGGTCFAGPVLIDAEVRAAYAAGPAPQRPGPGDHRSRGAVAA